ncbi:MAG TPA: YIP1 family protein [Chloroflexi bacterium]|nr:YIP1 family protein [Chloroflexota bacterium]
MAQPELPGFLETLRLALRLEPSIYYLLQHHRLGLAYAALIVLLAGVSESLGQSVVLFLNRVRPRRFVLALSITTVSHIVGYFLWTLTIWLVGSWLTQQAQPWHAVAVVVGLAYAPQIFAFFELTPYLGNLIWGVLSLWSMIAIVVALHFGLGMATWQALLVSSLGWIVMQALRRTVGRPILHLRAALQRRAAGVPLTVKKQDVAALRRHPVRDWYKQLEARRRSVRLSPVRKPPPSHNEQSHVHRVE